MQVAVLYWLVQLQGGVCCELIDQVDKQLKSVSNQLIVEYFHLFRAQPGAVAITQPSLPLLLGLQASFHTLLGGDQKDIQERSQGLKASCMAW
jgi:hypothetical protein